MADIYDVFSLPAPPPPTFLSFYNGPERARLPNFLASDDPIAAARKYLHEQIMFVCIPSLSIQSKIVTVLAGLILVSAISVIIRRLLQRSLWILRLKQTERGPLIVPNAIMIFAGTEGLFVIIFLALINSVYYAWDVIKQPLPNLILWISLTWSPLIAGPIWSSFGLWHARPPSSIPRNSRSVKQSWLFGTRIPFPKPLLISIFWLMIPIFQLMSVFGPALTGNGHRSEAVRLYYKWIEEHANATELTRPMLIELQTVWAEDLKAFYWLAITMFIWFSWTVILFIAYGFINLRLLLPLRAQLSALKEQHANISDPMTNGGDTRVAAKSGFGDAGNKSQIESVQLPLETPRLRSLAINYVGGRIETVDFQHLEDNDGEEDAIAVKEHWGLKVKDLQNDAVNNSFFPPIKPSAVIRPATDSETSERYLRAAYRHFLFQGTTISLAIFYFGQISLYLALTLYSYNERRIVGKAVDTAFLEAMWGCVFFASMVFISITLRTYEPVLVNLLNNNNSNIRPNRSALPSKDRSIKMNSLGSLRLHSGLDSKMSFSSSNATVVNSPTPTPRPPAMDPLTENDSSDDDHKGFTPNRGTREARGTDSPSISFTPITKYEVPDYIPGHGSSFTTSHIPFQDDEVMDQSSTYDTRGMNDVTSTSSFTDPSLREMPSMGSGNLRRLDELQTSALPRSASRAEASSPRHTSTERFPSASPSSSISTNSGFLTTGGLRIGASSTPAGREFVNALASAGSMQSEDDSVEGHRSAFVREMHSNHGATVLPPPPRSSSKRTSRTSRTSTST
ncbi:unnamed protein product [Tilletia caries]|uniref:Uncharacterized protein n=2 Tax=Tilletia TaxID=13289 RepID=A0A8X7SXB4_9BASI|nr:hypothetical protein CF336_g3975 [Tilletia laevis]KAE8198307.1 hypothetical protein CF328_g3595 [Tilletia controversa]KAE8261436.1 hypothetical protein A4X03_0g3259 [Tilletia caries]KAE8247557.1 hypothetical protein A4X06_0g4363 [Tilletia controversa]CAD6920039.1 unnamed protein product [Tilletia caries]